MRKRRDHTEFACFVRNHTEHPIPLTVPFGQMEERPKLSAAEHAALIERNRARYAAPGHAEHSPQPTGTAAGLGTPDML